MSLELTKTAREKWIKNQITFLKPLAIFVAVLYLGAIIPKIQKDGFQFSDLAITNLMITSVALYIANNLYDYFRKLKNEG